MSRARAESLLDRHGARLYGLLRLALPTAEEAERALSRILLAAGSIGGEPDWGSILTELALEEIAATPLGPVGRLDAALAGGGHGPGPLAGVARSERELMRALRGTGDRRLRVLIRSLDRDQRRVLVVSVICGLGDARAAALFGCDEDSIADLRRVALEALHERLAEGVEQERALRAEIAAVPYELRDVDAIASHGGGTPPDGNPAVEGVSVYYQRPPQLNLLLAFRDALKRAIDALRRRDGEGADRGPGLSDRSRKTGAPDPTPTLQPFERPKDAPSTRRRPRPEAAPGIGGYRTPGPTPSTQPLGNPRRPRPALGWASTRRTPFRRG